MPRAALRPSAMAQTMSDWPRCMSPAANTPGTLVIQRSSRPDVAALGEPDAEIGEHARPLRAHEAHREQHQIGVHDVLAAGDRLRTRCGRPPARALTLTACSCAHAAVGIAREPLGRHREDALAALLVRRATPGRCWATPATDCRRRARRAVAAAARTGAPSVAPWRCTVPRQSAPVSPPPMITTCLPSARDERVGADRVAFAPAVLLRQELHREVDARELASRHLQVARRARRRRSAARRRTPSAAARAARSTPTLTPVRNVMPSASQ